MSTWLKIIGVVLVLGAGGYAVYDQVVKWHDRALNSALMQAREISRTEVEGLNRQINDLQEELALRKEAVLPRERLEEVFGEKAGELGTGPAEQSCKELDRQVMDFLTYLDGKDYLKTFGPEQGSYPAFQQLVQRISENLPLIQEEMKDPNSLMGNVVHLYRTLGKKNIQLIQEVLKQENEIIEPVGALFFEWLLANDRCRGDGMQGRPSLEVQYEYAAFFLNTLAGRSYLLRRDSKLRLLTTYYCVLILDRANRQMLNRHGVDIRPHIDFSSYDVQTHRGLVSQKKYLDSLENLRRKYERNRNGEKP